MGYRVWSMNAACKALNFQLAQILIQFNEINNVLLVANLFGSKPKFR